jgi:hypothetical protein
MKKFLSEFSPGEPFNEEFIFAKDNDDVLAYVDDVAATLNVIEGVEYLGSELIADETELRPRQEDGKQWMSLDESRLDIIRMQWRITKGEETEVITQEVLYPKLIDHHYYLINGVKCYPIYQIVDSECFKTSRSVTLKTMVMPIILRHEPEEFEDMEGNVYNAHSYKLHLFHYKINYLLYYLSKKGFEQTIEYMGWDAYHLGLLDAEEASGIDQEVYRLFKVSGTSVLYASKEMLQDRNGLDMVASLLDVLEGKTRPEKAAEIEYWKRKLGSVFTKNTVNYVEKAESISISFERIIGSREHKVLRIDDEDKKDTYSVVRWMVRNYEELHRQDNMDLRHKRIRLHEYQLYPLLTKLSTGLYRALNTKDPKFNDLKQILRVGPGHVIKRLLNNDLLRYSSAVNGMDLFNSALKFSFRGPQSLADGGKTISTKYRGIHPSYIGRIALNTSSNGDPGMGGTFCPFIQPHGQYFTKER